MKKLLMMLGVVMAAVVAFGDPLPPGGPYRETVEGIEWTFSIHWEYGGELIASVGSGDELWTAIPQSTMGNVTIPETLGGRVVRVVDSYAFCGCSGMTSITLPKDVLSIGYRAFYNCTGLGEGVVIVDDCVLTVNGRCPGFVVLPEGTRLIAGGAFEECGSLTDVTIPLSLTTIEEMAFQSCGSLTDVTIPSSVTNIFWDAFRNCNSLNEVDFEGAPPSGLYDVGIKQDAVIRYNVKYEAEWKPVIQQCGWKNAKPYDPLEPMSEGGPYREIVNGIKWKFRVDADLNASVGTGSSEGTAVPSSTTGSITVPTTLGGRTVTAIGWCAFMHCSGLANVTIPSGVTSIKDYAFAGCSGLANVTIPSSVTSIGEYAFDDCRGLTSITIPSSVTSIGMFTFRFCRGLTNVTIPSSVTSIGEGAFYDCSRLTNVTIPSSVTSIGEGAFYDCDGLTSITIPPSVTSIGEGAFADCALLQSIEVSEGNNKYASQDGVLFNKTKTTLVQCPGRRSGVFEVPSSVTSIGGYAFYSCSGLTGVTIPLSVTSIGGYAFYSCKGLTNVTIPLSVTNIGNSAFSGCTGLTNVTISSSVTSIGDGAFSWCSCLNSVDFEGAPPSGVSSASIKRDATVRYNVKYEAEWIPVIQQCGWKNAKPYVPVKPEGGPYKETVEGIEWTFMVDTNLEASVGTGSSGGTAVPTSTTGAITIPSSLGGRTVTDISTSAFCNCTNITSVVIPDGIASIGSTAFFGCTKLTCATIPSSVKEIWSRAFARCYNLTDLYLADDVAPQLSFGGSIGNHFDACNWDLIMHVPSTWKGRGRTLYGYTVFRDGEETDVRMTVTNVVVHYIQTSELSPMAAPITPDVGIVNVMTEIEGGIVAVPESWATNYPTFKQKFGDDFAVALTRETGKFDANRKPMYVWQDYVAGTDPTNVEDQFRASVTMVGGKPVISFTPVLSEKEAAKRVYTTYGKVKLQDEQWEVITAGEEDDYNFFKVTVKMK